MDAIYIPQLTKAPERTEEIQVNEFLPGLETLTPVRGSRPRPASRQLPGSVRSGRGNYYLYL